VAAAAAATAAAAAAASAVASTGADDADADADAAVASADVGDAAAFLAALSTLFRSSPPANLILCTVTSTTTLLFALSCGG
jgi:hypothetical protein